MPILQHLRRRISVFGNRIASARREYKTIKREFDCAYYLHQYGDVRKNGIDACLHYIRFGWKEGRDPAPWFNTNYYLQSNPDVDRAAINPFYHYLAFGRDEGRPPPTIGGAGVNIVMPFEELALVDTFDLEAYQHATGRVFPSTREALDHAMERTYIPFSVLGRDREQSASLLVDLGDRCRLRGSLSAAAHFYAQALELDPENFFAHEHLGDSCMDSRNFAGAIRSYQAALAINSEYVWTHLNISKSLFSLERYPEALSYAKAAHKLSDGATATRVHLERCAHAYGHQLIGAGFKAAKSNNMALSRQLMNEAASVGPARERPVENRLGSYRRTRALRVAILADSVLPQCLLYRVKNKAYQLEKAGVAVQWFPRDAVRDFVNASNLADLAIIYRLPATPEIVDAIRYVRALGKPTYYDIDDLIFSHTYYPDPYESYSNLISRDQYAGLAAGAELFRLAMRECDFGIASTLPLAEHMSKEVITGEVIVVPNSFGAEHLKVKAAEPKTPTYENTHHISIFYGTGTLAHKSYFEKFSSEVLAPVLRRNPNVTLRLIGNFPTLAALAPLKRQVRIQTPNWDFEQYLSELSKADLNIAPLPRSTFNDCKSEIKWLEAAMFGIPSVLCRTTTHELTVEDGKTGFLCSTSDEWIAAVDRLINDRLLRESVGRAAMRSAEERYNTARIGQDLKAELENRFAGDVSQKKKIRVVVVNVFYPPQAIGGATRVVYENVDSLIRRYGNDIEVLVFTTTDENILDYSTYEYEYNDVRVTSVKVPGRARFEWNPTDDRVKAIFTEYLNFYEPDLVHFHCVQRLTGSVVEATRDLNIPYVVTVHDGWWLSDYQFLVDQLGNVHTGYLLTLDGMRDAGIEPASIERTVYLRDLLRDARNVISVSDPFAEIYKDVGLANVVTVENGTIKLEPIERDEKAGSRIQVGFIGGLAAHKGFNLVREIWATHRFENIELVLVDHAQAADRIRNIYWNGNPVKIIGRVPQSKITALYSALDVLLAPSIWPESFGLVTREAAQAGLWLIASDRGAIGDIVDETNGFRLDVSNSEALASTLESIDREPEKYKQRTGYSRRLKTFDEQVDDTVKIYQTIASSSVKELTAIEEPMCFDLSN